MTLRSARLAQAFGKHVAPLLVFAVLAPSALAQSAAPAVGALSGALALRGAIDMAREHGCSRSHESVNKHATVRLDVDRRGRAALTLGSSSIVHSGPSLGRFRQGDRGFSEVIEEHRVVWTGTAQRSASGLALRFGRADKASIRFVGPGTLPLGPSRAGPADVRATCQMSATPLLPAVPVEGEQATATRLLHCAFVGRLPAPLDLYGVDDLVFGSGLGTRVVRRDTMFGPATVELRAGQ